MKNISCKEVLKAKSSAPFISIIGLYFIVFFLLHIICLIHAIKVLVLCQEKVQVKSGIFSQHQ